MTIFFYDIWNPLVAATVEHNVYVCVCVYMCVCIDKLVPRQTHP